MKPVLSRASLLACVAAIVIGVYQSEHAYVYMVQREWLPEEPSWAHLPLTNSQFFTFISNSSRSSASELSSALTRMGSHLDIHQFQNWLAGAFYSRFSYSSDPTRIGLSMAKKGLKPKHPVLIIPGS